MRSKKNSNRNSNNQPTVGGDGGKTDDDDGRARHKQQQQPQQQQTAAHTYRRRQAATRRQPPAVVVRHQHNNNNNNEQKSNRAGAAARLHHPPGRAHQMLSDLGFLEAAHQKYPWIPGRDNIRPTPDVINDKVKYLTAMDLQYSSTGEFVLNEIFGGDSTAQIAFHSNKFPYNLPLCTHHWLLWVRDGHMLSVEEINAIIISGLPNDSEFTWYENPKQSLPDVWHIQVFWHHKDDFNDFIGGSGTCFVIESFFDRGIGARAIILKRALPEAALTKMAGYFEDNWQEKCTALKRASASCCAVFIWSSAVYSLAVEALRQGLGSASVESLLLNESLPEEIRAFKEADANIKTLKKDEFTELKALKVLPVAIQDLIGALELMCGKKI